MVNFTVEMQKERDEIKDVGCLLLYLHINVDYNQSYSVVSALFYLVFFLRKNTIQIINVLINKWLDYGKIIVILLVCLFGWFIGLGFLCFVVCFFK